MPLGQALSTPTSQPIVTPAPVATAPKAGPTATGTPAKVRHIIRPGDTLLGLAQQYHVSMATIQLANDLGESDVIRAGQALDIPTGPRWDGESPYWIVHTVRRGETLTGIAQTFGMTSSDIQRVNGIADPGLIVPGQPLVIPLDSLQVAAAPPTSSPTPAALRARVSLTASPSPRPTTPTAPPTLVPAVVPAEAAGWPAAVVALINQKRAAHGLPPYSIAPELMRAAQAHADDCAARGWGSHVGSDGSDTRARDIRAGYKPTAWGENWVKALDPAKAVEFWYNETPPNDPHRKNLLHTRYDQVGVGITQAEYGYYFIADFASR